MKFLFKRITLWAGLLGALWLAGLYAAFIRYYQGLGAATHLSDSWPWGLAIGFDVLVGVGLAAGGFVITATVYVFHLEKYKPLVRPALLTALIGYLLVIAALLYDLGKPWNIWHPIIMWNPHSVMFEVAWCVMLYTTVLFCEFAPSLIERFGFSKTVKAVTRVTPFLVMIGVLLSTMHQSSLGALYVIMPGKLHPLWHNSLLPAFFFVSSISAGLGMIIFESNLSHYALGQALQRRLLQSLGRPIILVQLVWLLGRMLEIIINHKQRYIFDGSFESYFFIAELTLLVVLPVVIFSIRKIYSSRLGLLLGAVSLTCGFVLHRLNVAIIGMTRSAGTTYFPSWMEWVITASLITAGIMAFRFTAKHLPVFDHHDADRQAAPAGRTALMVTLLLCGFMMIVFSAVRFGFQGNDAASAAVLQPAAELRLPAAIAFEQADGSPGIVTFNHDTHVDPDKPDCKFCHAAMFQIRPEKAGKRGTVKMAALYEKKQCGACHDGERAFTVNEGCENCHSGN